LKPSTCRGRFAIVLAVLAGGTLIAPAAATAALTITSAPTDPTAVTTPAFAGGGAQPHVPVTVVLTPVDGGADPADLAATPGPGGNWTAASSALADGTYAASATQAGNDASATVQFRVDTIAPAPTVTQPAAVTASSTPVLGGAAGNATGDSATVTVELHAGSGGAGALISSQAVARNGAVWTATAPALPPGQYSVSVAQADSLGHVGRSTWRDFTVDSTAPAVTVTKPGAVTASGSPTLGGAAGNDAGDAQQVDVELYRFAHGTGDLVQAVKVTRNLATWSYTVSGPLAPGAYSVRAAQSDALGNKSTTPWLDFTIVSADFTISPEEVQVGGTVTLAALTAGLKYAWNLDDDGKFDDGTTRTVSRVVTSAAPRRVLLRVTAPDGTTNVAARSITPGNRAPNADFDVAPAQPTAGQPVRLTSTSSDPDGQPLASEGWDLDGDGRFDEATGGIVSMVFPAAGTYRVGLRVVDQAGASREATKFITVGLPPTPPPPPQPQTGGGSDASPAPAPPLPAPAPAPPVAPTQRALLSPFPIVRIVGEVTSRGIRLRRLSVTAPKGATVRARCKGTGCPRKIAALRARSTAGIRIRGLERRELRAGTVIEVFVAAEGRIGKYTRLLVRRGKAPERGDRCLSTNGRSPISCPVG
jgi:PKD domain/Bacterial Ig-like domain